MASNEEIIVIQENAFYTRAYLVKNFGARWLNRLTSQGGLRAAGKRYSGKSILAADEIASENLVHRQRTSEKNEVQKYERKTKENLEEDSNAARNDDLPVKPKQKHLRCQASRLRQLQAQESDGD